VDTQEGDRSHRYGKGQANNDALDKQIAIQ